jgi:hypothetical protein
LGSLIGLKFLRSGSLVIRVDHDGIWTGRLTVAIAALVGGLRVGIHRYGADSQKRQRIQDQT